MRSLDLQKALIPKDTWIRFSDPLRSTIRKLEKDLKEANEKSVDSSETFAVFERSALNEIQELESDPSEAQDRAVEAPERCDRPSSNPI